MGQVLAKMLGMERDISLDDTTQEIDAKLHDAFDFFKNEKGYISTEHLSVIMKALGNDLPDTGKTDIDFEEFKRRVQENQKKMDVETELIQCLEFLNQNYENSSMEKVQPGEERKLTNEFIIKVLEAKTSYKLDKDDLEMFKKTVRIKDIIGVAVLPDDIDTPKKFIQKFMNYSVPPPEEV